MSELIEKIRAALEKTSQKGDASITAAHMKLLDDYEKAVAATNRWTMKSAASLYASGYHDGLLTAVRAIAPIYGVSE